MIKEVDAAISDILLCRAQTLNTQYEFAVPGVGHIPGSEPFIHLSLFKNPTEQVTYSDIGYNRHSGFLQASVFWPTGEGTIKAEELAGSMASLFKRGVNLADHGRVVRIIFPPTVGGPEVDTDWVNVPVTIRWQSDNLNQ